MFSISVIEFSLQTDFSLKTFRYKAFVIQTLKNDLSKLPCKCLNTSDTLQLQVDNHRWFGHQHTSSGCCLCSEEIFQASTGWDQLWGKTTIMLALQLGEDKTAEKIFHHMVSHSFPSLSKNCCQTPSLSLKTSELTLFFPWHKNNKNNKNNPPPKFTWRESTKSLEKAYLGLGLRWAQILASTPYT